MRERRSPVATPAARKPKSIFSTTLFQRNSANCWNTTDRSGPGPVTRLFPTVSEPVVGKSSPAAMRRHVVLPHPEGPTTATNSFSRTSKLTLSTAAISLPSRRNSRVTPSNTILLIADARCSWQGPPHLGQNRETLGDRRVLSWPHLPSSVRICPHLPLPGRKPAVDENRLAGYIVRSRAGK